MRVVNCLRSSLVCFVMGLVAATALFVGVGCEGKGNVHASELDSLITIVSDRHDAYVRADTSLMEVERSTALRSTKQLRAVIDTALERTATTVPEVSVTDVPTPAPVGAIGPPATTGTAPPMPQGP